MAFGPVDLLVVEFKGNHFTGKALREIHQLVSDGFIRVIDMVILTKDAEGNLAKMEITDVKPEIASDLDLLKPAISQMLTMGDIDDIGALLDNETTAGVLLYENVWATKALEAIKDAGGKLVIAQRIPHEDILAAVEELKAMVAAL
ncbi:MAG: DUF6325 family protein [Anaerolineae bacterium]